MAEDLQRSVLVVDDMRELSASIAEFLQDEGYRATCVGDGAAALAHLREPGHRPDVILLDLLMPGMNGWEFRRQQLRDPSLADIPVVVLTSRRELEGIVVDHVIYKPVDFDRLRDVVRACTGAARGVYYTALETPQGDRQLRTLQQLGAQLFGAATPLAVAERAARVLSENPTDIPWSLCYLPADEPRTAGLVASSGSSGAAGAAAIRYDDDDAEWPLGPAAAARRALLVEPRGKRRAICFPLARSEDEPVGFLIIGLARRLESRHHGFLQLVADEVARALVAAQPRLPSPAPHLDAGFEAFERAPFPVCVLRGSALVIEAANPHFLAAIGRSDLLGALLTEVIPPVSRWGLVEALRGALATGAPVIGYEVPAAAFGVDPPQGAIWSFAGAPLSDPRGVVDRVLVLCADVTERVRARGSADAANGEGSPRAEVELLLSLLGHDLRDSLAAVHAAATLLERRADSHTLSRPLARITTNVARMERMISQLLDFTRIRLGGGLRLETTAMDLAGLARVVVEELGAAPGRLRLQVSGDTQGQWDYDRLAQLLTHLAANACEHGLPDRDAVLAVDGGSRAAVRIEVTSGGAIPPEVLPVLLDPLLRGRTRSPGGLGLGLFISQQIAMAHGGTLEVRSERTDALTRVVVVLPRQPA